MRACPRCAQGCRGSIEERRTSRVKRRPGRIPIAQDLRDAAAACAASDATAVPWDTVKAVVRHAREHKGTDAAPSLEQVDGRERGAGAHALGPAAGAGAAAVHLPVSHSGLSPQCPISRPYPSVSSPLYRCARAAALRFRSPARRRASRRSWPSG